MAGASPLERDSTASPQSAGGGSVRNAVTLAVRRVGFWTAVVSPAVLLVLFVSGLVAAHPYLAVGLLAVNLAGLVLGRNYKR